MSQQPARDRNADLYRELEKLTKQDVKKMTYTQYLEWYASVKDLQSYFSFPIIPLDMFQAAYDVPLPTPISRISPTNVRK